MIILFPSDYFNLKLPDPDYKTEYKAVCKLPFFKITLYNYDEFVSSGKINMYPGDYYTGFCIYRGWMLNPEQYRNLYEYLSSREIQLINAPEQYNECHLFPNALRYIEKHTPKSLFFPMGAAVDWDMVNSTFKRFMMKDYVKSVKGTDFPKYFSTPVSGIEMEGYKAEFIRLRDTLFTDGIVLKEYVDFKQYGTYTNEYRAFFLNGQLLSTTRNSNQPQTCPAVPLDFVMRFNNLLSNYYTIDFGELANGEWVVIETGDGQVSGLSPGQFPFKYYDDMRFILE